MDTMSKRDVRTSRLINQQAASVLLEAAFNFLRRSNLSDVWIKQYLSRKFSGRKSSAEVAQFRRLLSAYEDMGVVMSTWFVNPKYLDKSGNPRRLTSGRGPMSIAGLVRTARVKTISTMALDLMRRSSSIQIDADGSMVPLNRVFVLPGFEVPRAALVIERYLETSSGNSIAHSVAKVSLLERNCHVAGVNLRKFAPILRDIKERGAAFMDSVDGEIESHRLKKTSRREMGDVDVFVFAWAQRRTANRFRRATRNSRSQKLGRI